MTTRAKSRAARRRQKKQAKLRSQFALQPIPKRRGDGRVRKPAPRKLKPTKAQQARRDRLRGISGDPNDPLRIAVADGQLNEVQAEALHRYRQITIAYRKSIDCPRAGMDMIANLLPRSAGCLPDEEALEWLQKEAKILQAVTTQYLTRNERFALTVMIEHYGEAFASHIIKHLQKCGDILAASMGLDEVSEAA